MIVCPGRRAATSNEDTFARSAYCRMRITRQDGVLRPELNNHASGTPGIQNDEARGSLSAQDTQGAEADGELRLTRPTPQSLHGALAQSVLGSLSIPVWVLDLSEFCRTCVRSASPPLDNGKLHCAFLRGVAVLWVNEAAIAFHAAACATELQDALPRIFTPQTAKELARAMRALDSDGHAEIDVLLGRVRGEPVRARARLDRIAAPSDTTRVAMSLLPPRRLHSLLSALPDMAFELDADGVYIDFAGPAHETLVAPSEFLGKSVTQTLPHEVAHRTLAALQRLRACGGHERFEYTLALSDGLHWYEARMTALPHGGAAAYVRDITEQKCVQWRLQQSEQRFHEVAECGAPVMLWTTSGGDLCTFCNKTALDFSKTYGDPRGEGWMHGVHPDDVARCQAVFLRHLESHEPFQIEFRMRRHDGQYRWLLAHAAPRFVEGKFAGFTGASIDITDFKQLSSA